MRFRRPQRPGGVDKKDSLMADIGRFIGFDPVKEASYFRHSICRFTGGLVVVWFFSAVAQIMKPCTMIPMRARFEIRSEPVQRKRKAA